MADAPATPEDMATRCRLEPVLPCFQANTSLCSHSPGDGPVSWWHIDPGHR